MSGWDQTRRRHRLVYAVAEDISRHGAGVVDGWQAEIDTEFGELAPFLCDVQRRWHTAVDAHLDLVLEAQPTDATAAVEAILTTAGRANAQLVAVLDAFAAHPALAEGRERHRQAVLAATGVDYSMLTPVSTRTPRCS